MRKAHLSAVVLALSVGASGAPAAGAVAAETKLRVLKRATASGPRASVRAAVVARKPNTIVLRVLASPWQRATVRWRADCATVETAKVRTGRFAARAPLTRTIPLPLRRPAACSFSARATLAVKGRVTVLVLKTP